MKKIILLSLILSSIRTACAQDIIVTDNGETIKAYNVEVATSKIYYTVAPQSEESKSIQKDKVLVWKKADGTNVIIAKDNAEDNSAASTPANESPNNLQPQMTDALIAENQRLISEFNSRFPEYYGEKSDYAAMFRIYTLNLSPYSIIEDSNIKVTFSMKRCMMSWDNQKIKYTDIQDREIYNGWSDNGTWSNFGLATTIHNKTDKTIYVDLANCFSLLNGEASPYYVPTATSVSTGRTTGTSVNAGSIAGALGIGGRIGALAGGLNLGNANNSSTTTITYSQRVISIPPMSSKTLDPKFIGKGYVYTAGPNPKKSWPQKNFAYYDVLAENVPSEYKDKDNMAFRKLKKGEVITLQEENMTYPLGMSYTYSFTENIESPQSIRMYFGLKSVVGVDQKRHWPNWDYINLESNPLIYF